MTDKKKKLVFSKKKKSSAAYQPQVTNQDKWKILIADDEPEVHEVTKLALRKFEFRGKTLNLINAYSAQEAEQLLRVHPDMAVILLDVVMEADDSGLRLIETIRNELQNQLVRIILRTGQPGQAPEKKVIVEYDINDYKLKTELTSQRLFVTLVTALRSYHDLTLIETSRAELTEMYGNLEKEIVERKQLEQQIQESLKRRTGQVQISSEVAQDIAAAPALDELFRRVVNLVKDRFGYYYAHVYTLEGPNLVMQEGTGEAGYQMKKLGHKIASDAEKSLVARAARLSEPVLISDVSQESGWLPNLYLPDTKSELAVPIKLGAEVLGVLDVQGNALNGVSDEDQLLLLGLCGQIASAVRSTRLLEEANTFRMFVEASGQGFGMATLEGQVTYANPTFCQLLDQDKAEDMYGKNLALHYPAEMQQRISAEVIPAVMARSQWLGESVLLSAKGKLTPVIENFFLIRDKNGQPLYLADVVTDITERKRTEAELEDRIQELNCLTDIGRKIADSPPVPDLLTWVTKRVPAAMQYPDLCQVAIEYGGEIYGQLTAIDMLAQIVHALRVGGQVVGRIYIAYAEKHDFIDEESALLGGIANRISSYIESSLLLKQIQRQAEQEHTVRAITDKIRKGADRASILRIAQDEIRQMLGASNSMVQLGTQEQLLSRLKDQPEPNGQNQGNGSSS